MAPTIAGTNCITIAEDAIISMLADSTACRTFLSAADATEAKTKIYCHDIPQPDDDAFTDADWAALFPSVLILPPEDGNLFAASLSALPHEYDVDLAFILRFERYWPDGMDEQDGVRDFMNKVGSVIEDLLDAAKAGGAFGFTAITNTQPMYTASYARYESLGRVQGWEFSVQRNIQ